MRVIVPEPAAPLAPKATVPLEIESPPVKVFPDPMRARVPVPVWAKPPEPVTLPEREVVFPPVFVSVALVLMLPERTRPPLMAPRVPFVVKKRSFWIVWVWREELMMFAPRGKNPSCS